MHFRTAADCARWVMAHCAKASVLDDEGVVQKRTDSASTLALALDSVEYAIVRMYDSEGNKIKSIHFTVDLDGIDEV